MQWRTKCSAACLSSCLSPWIMIRHGQNWSTVQLHIATLHVNMLHTNVWQKLLHRFIFHNWPTSELHTNTYDVLHKVWSYWYWDKHCWSYCSEKWWCWRRRGSTPIERLKRQQWRLLGPIQPPAYLPGCWADTLRSLKPSKSSHDPGEDVPHFQPTFYPIWAVCLART